jgi:hypothetical protein
MMKGAPNIRYKRGASVWTLLLAVVVIAAAFSPASAQEVPYRYYLEAGVDFAHFTNDVGNGNGQWVAFILSKPANFDLRLDVGRAERWDDEGIGVGAAFTKYLDRVRLGVGAATGSADFIQPEYRFSGFAGYNFLAEGNLIVVLGYLREQSKAENYFDRIELGVTYYANEHWIYGGYFHYTIGQPGDTITKTIAAGVTWFTWEKRFIGGLVEWGDVNYTQVSEEDFLVAYEQFMVRANYTEYFNPTFGATLRADWATNKFWDVYGIAFSIFKVW